MRKTSPSPRLDVAAFARTQEMLEGTEPLQQYERLAYALQAPEPDLMVHWRVQGEHRTAVDGSVRPGLHLVAEAELPMTCQRCMGAVRVPVRIDRHFVFVPDEATAAALDDESEDDVLELTAALDLHGLIEDELLMALPLVPRHDECPGAVQLSAQDADFDAAGDGKPNPFAALAALKGRKTD